MNPYIYEKMLEEKRDQMLREAARTRLIRQSHVNHPPLRITLVLWLAKILIRIGEKMRSKYADCLQPETKGSEQLCTQKQ